MNILIVEDEKKIADSLNKGLNEMGYDVTVAYDGIIGEKMLNQESFDLVILDINLPGINGLELVQKDPAEKQTGSCFDAHNFRIRSR
jgi:two-component system copper resistance phosphate regulon response regulator CusR